MKILRPLPPSGRVEVPWSQPTPDWWFRDDQGHLTVGEILVRDDKHVDARILLDNLLLYQSRHSSRAAAQLELAELRHRLSHTAAREIQEIKTAI